MHCYGPRPRWFSDIANQLFTESAYLIYGGQGDLQFDPCRQSYRSNTSLDYP